jgi:hypothetical protein
MNDEDKITEIVADLNRTKQDIVRPIKDFVKHGRVILEKTTNEQRGQENIAAIVQKVEALESLTLPDFVLRHAPTPTTSKVRILHPTKGSPPVVEGTDIQLIFETNVPTPFMYYVTGKEKTNLTDVFPIKAFRSNTAKVDLPSIKESDRNPLKAGTYIITVQILDPSTRKDIATPDQVTIEITPKAGPTPTTKNTVEITSPIAGVYNKLPISVEFEAKGPYHEDSKKEYMYMIIALDKDNKEVFSEDGRTTGGKKVKCKEIANLQDGTYKIDMITYSLPDQKELATSKEVTFVINAGTGPTPAGSNTVKVVSPVAASSPYKNIPIPIQFEVAGPHHDAGKEYLYSITVVDSSKKVFEDNGIAKDKQIIHAKPLDLPDGSYTIGIITHDIVTKNTLATSRPEHFVINRGSIGPNPTPIINNVIINNNNNVYEVDLPFTLPINIEIKPSDPKYITNIITQPINIRISVTKEGSSAILPISPKDDTIIGELKHTLKEEIPFKDEGKYNLFIILYSQDKKVIYRKVLPVEVKKKGGGPVGPTPKRGTAVFSVIVGGKDIKSGNTYTTEIKPGKKSMIKIRNSGTGGNLVWRANSDPWIKVTPPGSIKPMKKGTDNEVIIEIDTAKLAALQTKDVKYGRVLIEGAYGTKISPDNWKTIAGKCLINFKLK